MESGATDEYEHGSAYWIRKYHRKVDPDYNGSDGLVYDDSKPAHEKTFAE
jgi:hypothetical protein